jgi:hypothetical protein
VTAGVPDVFGGVEITGAGGLDTVVENGAAATGWGAEGASDEHAASVRARAAPTVAVAVRRTRPA